ncbi:hypothetical protein [Nitratifractor sp.]
MKLYPLLFISLSCITLSAAEHYARFEPYERATIKAAAAGEILEANLSAEGHRVDDGVIVRIDDRLDRLDLNRSKASLKLIARTLDLTRQMLPGLKESADRQERYSQRMSKLSTASQTQKDQAYLAAVNARNQYLSTLEKESTLQGQLLDLQQKISLLEDRIAKKNVRLKGRYLYRLDVRRGEYASPGMPLAIADDLRRGKLVVYLSPEEIEGIERKKIWIDGKATDLRFAKIWKVSDEKYLSSYRAEIVLPPRFTFSSLHKVELK